MSVFVPRCQAQGFKEMGGLQSLGLPKELEAWRQRVCWLQRQRPEEQLPDLSDEALASTAHVWLKPFLTRVRSKADLTKLDWQAILYERVGGWQRARSIEDLAPAYLTMPTGTRVLVDYSRSVSDRRDEDYRASPLIHPSILTQGAAHREHQDTGGLWLAIIAHSGRRQGPSADGAPLTRWPTTAGW